MNEELETRIALVDQKVNLTLKSIDKRLEGIERNVSDLPTLRAGLKTVCDELSEHKAAHWKTATLTISIAGIVMGIITKLLR